MALVSVPNKWIDDKTPCKVATGNSLLIASRGVLRSEVGDWAIGNASC